MTTAGTTFSGLAGGTTYAVKLTAVGDGTVYANSATASQTGTPGATQLATPSFTLTPGPGALIINAFTVVPNASGYSYQVCNAGGTGCGAATSVTTAGTTTSGLTGGTTYTVKLIAIGDGTTYADSAAASRTGTPLATPLATPSFSLSPGSSSLTLNAFSAVPNASSYSARRCDAAGNNCAAAVTVTITGTTFSGLTDGTTYTIKLTAVGDGTAFATSATASQTGTPGSTQLATPALSVTPDPGSLTINPFAAVPFAISYSYQVCDAAGNNCAAAVTVTITGTTFSGLTDGTTYTIKLTAVGDGVVYATSVPASVTSTPVAPNF